MLRRGVFFSKTPTSRSLRESSYALRPVAKIGVEQEIVRTRIFDFETAKKPERILVHLPAVKPNPLRNYQPGSTAEGSEKDQRRYFRNPLLVKIQAQQLKQKDKHDPKSKKEKKPQRGKALGKVAKHNPSFGIAEQGEVAVDQFPASVLTKIFDAINSVFKVKK